MCSIFFCFVFTHTDKKENKTFLICKEIQKGAVATSYIFDDLPHILRISSYITKPFLICIWLCNRSLWISLHLGKILFSFLSVQNWVETGFILKSKGRTSRDSILWSHWAPNDQTVSDRSLIVSASANACFMSSHFSVPSDHQHFCTRTYRFCTMLSNTRL